LGTITLYVLAQQLFGASASFLYRLATAPLSKGITTWFPQKNHPSAMFSKQLDGFVDIQPQDFSQH